MLILVFGVGQEKYGLEAGKVIEVVPSVPLRGVPHAPAFVAGLLNYRGRILPVVDLLQMIEGRPCKEVLSTRVMVVDCAAAGAAPRLVGLRAEHVTETLRVEESDFVDSSVRVREAPYIGRVFRNRRGMILQICTDKLVAERSLDELLVAPGEAC